MRNGNLTAGKTAQSFPMHLYIIKDCHWNHNIKVKVDSSFKLMILEALCARAGFMLAPRKVKSTVGKEVAA